MTSSAIIVPFADAIVDRVKASGAAGGVRWAPRDVSPPAGVVELPAISRTPVDAAEDHLGQRDWTLTYPVIFYFDLATAQSDQDRAADVIESFIEAIDAEPDLGLAPAIQEAKVIDALEPEFPADDARALIRWPTTVEILAFIS